MRRPVSKEGRAFTAMNLFGLTTRMVYLGLLSGAPVVAPASGTKPALHPVVLGSGEIRPNRSALGSVNQMEAQSGPTVTPAGPSSEPWAR